MAIFAGLLISAFAFLVGVPAAAAELAFFKTTADKEAYGKSPAKYERVILPSRSGSDKVYVERTAALRIRAAEIESVVVEESPGMPEELRRAMEEALRGRGIAKDVSDCQVTFVLNKRSAERFNDFVSRNSGERVDLRFNNHRLGVPRLVGEFGGNTFSLLAFTDDDRLREILEPVKERVVWKCRGGRRQ